MRRCFIHLGMHKTGSTSIQRSMQGYDDGTTAYMPLGNPNHSLALMAMFRSDPQGRASAAKRAGIDPASVPNRIARLEQAIVASDRHMILSGEGLSYFPDAQSVAALTTFLRRHFGQITALAYVREPRSYMQSEFQQKLRNGAPAFDPEQHNPRYRQRFLNWIDDLDRANVTLVEFAPQRLAGGDLIDDFAARAGLPLPFTGRDVGRANKAMSATAIAALFAHRQARGTYTHAGYTKTANSLVLKHLSALGGDSFAYAEDVAAQALRTFAGDIAWMESQLGQSFLPFSARPGTIFFSTPEEILHHTENTLETLREWLQKVVGVSSTRHESAVDVIDAAYSHCSGMVYERS